jgi:hypothetical protein
MKALKDVFFMHNLAKREQREEWSFLWLGSQFMLRPYKLIGVNIVLRLVY